MNHGEHIGLIVETPGWRLMSPGVDDWQKCGQRVDCCVSFQSHIADLQFSGVCQLNECGSLVSGIQRGGESRNFIKASINKNLDQAYLHIVLWLKRGLSGTGHLLNCSQQHDCPQNETISVWTGWVSLQFNSVLFCSWS